MNQDLAALFFQALHDCTYVTDRKLRDDAVYEVICVMAAMRLAHRKPEANNGSEAVLSEPSKVIPHRRTPA